MIQKKGINYINNGKTNFRVLIANRVNKIRNSFKTEEWFYVSTNQNLADDVTQYKGFDNLTNRSRWCVKPDFLNKEVTLESLRIISITNSATQYCQTT